MTDLMDIWLGIHNYFEPDTIIIDDYLNQNNPDYIVNQRTMLTQVNLSKSKLADYQVKIRETEHYYIENEVLFETRYIKQFKEFYIEIVYPLVGERTINTKPGIFIPDKYDLVKSLSLDRFLQEYHRFYHELKMAI